MSTQAKTHAKSAPSGKLLTCEQAWAKVLAHAKPLGKATVKLDDAVGLTLAENVRAPMNVPPFDNSAMDGFAVKVADIQGASGSRPIRLDVVTTIAAGDHWSGSLRRGQAAKIMTGAAIPKGADTIVMKEVTRSGEGWVEILAEKPKGEAVRKCGSDMRENRVALKNGKRLGPSELTILASMGLPKVAVWKRPRVGFLASGSELKAPGTKLRPGEIYESSHWAICESLRQLGADVEWLGVARDDRAETQRMVKRGLKCDVLLTAGGVSVGEFDYVRDSIQRAGAREIFWRVAQRPGKPLLFATCGKTLVFGLPGNPVSSMVSTEMYVKPALRKMIGLAKEELFPPTLKFPVAERIKKPGNLRTFHRASLVRRDGKVMVTLTHPNQSSGIFSTMLNAHVLMNLPPGPSAIEAGEDVECFVVDAERCVRAYESASVRACE